MKPPAIVLFSGGLDSLLCLGRAIIKSDSVIPLYIHYGQDNNREFQSCLNICNHYGIELKELSINLKALYPDKIPLLDAPGEILKARRPIDESVYVPSRNLIFLSLAVSMAEAYGSKTIYSGLDNGTYMDSRIEFIDGFEDLIYRELCFDIAIKTPCATNDFKDLIRDAHNHRAPFHLTWSCHHDRESHCNECSACYLRGVKFERAGIPDPLFLDTTTPIHSI